MQPRPRSAGFGRLDVLLSVALLLVLGFMMIPSLTLRAAARRDQQRFEDMRRVESAIAHYRTDHGCWPPAQESPANDGWDVSNDGDFIPALREGGYLPDSVADPRNDAQYQYRYRVFANGSFGCAKDGSTYVLGVRSFETLSTRDAIGGGFRCPDRDFTQEFAWVGGDSAPAR